MLENLKCLIGEEFNLLELSREIFRISPVADDITSYGNWEEILHDKSVVVAFDEFGEYHIQIFFDVVFAAGEDEIIFATYIKITDICNF